MFRFRGSNELVLHRQCYRDTTSSYGKCLDNPVYLQLSCFFVAPGPLSRSHERGAPTARSGKLFGRFLGGSGVQASCKCFDMFSYCLL